MKKSSSKTRRDTSWGELSTQEAGEVVRMESRYNRSSLAVEPDSYPYEHAKTARLVQLPTVGRVTAPTFASLDAAVAQRNPKSRVISGIVHVGGACLVVWLGIHTRTIPVPAN